MRAGIGIAATELLAGADRPLSSTIESPQVVCFVTPGATPFVVTEGITGALFDPDGLPVNVVNLQSDTLSPWKAIVISSCWTAELPQGFNDGSE